MDYLNNFYHGVIKKGFDADDVFNNWKYAGGDKERHARYAKLMNITPPSHTDSCLCGHHIVENCYITDGENILIVGNSCIKRYVKKHTRTCERCGNTHRAQKHNYCKKCKASVEL